MAVRPDFPLSLDDIQPDLRKKTPGQSKITTPRDEADKVEILSGVYDGLTLEHSYCHAGS